MKIETKYGGDPQFAPQFISNVFEVLTAHNGECNRDQVKQFLSPANPELFDQHMNLAIKFSLFDEVNGLVKVPQTCSIQSSRLSAKSLSRYMADVLITKELPTVLNSLQALLLWTYSIRPVHEVAGQKTTTIPKKYDVFEPFASDTGLHGRERVFNGRDQHAATRRWLEAMGLMIDVGKETYVLSYELAIECFRNLLPQSSRPIRDVITEFRDSCPYLPGGKWNELWMQTFTPSTPQNVNSVAKVGANEISEIESLILNYLQSIGMIKLEDRNDAPDRMKLSITGQEERMLSHIASFEKDKE
jgi:hypothetical protein